MAINRHVLLPRSSKQGSKPTVNSIAYGELTVNYNANHEFLATKNSDGNIITFSSDNSQDGLWKKGTGESAVKLDTGATASGKLSVAEGKGTSAQGENSHAEGLGTITTNIAEHASGKYNQSNPDQIYSIGVGTANDHRRNAIMVMQNGDTSISGGTLNVSGDTHFHGPYNYLSGTTIIENLSATSGTFDDALSETSVNAVQNSAITKVIFDNEKVTAASLNDLNDRKLDYSGVTTDTAMTYTASSASGVKLSHTKKTAITDGKLKIITTDDFGHVIGARDAVATDIAGFDNALSETSINAVQNSAVTRVIFDNEKVTAASLNDLNDRKLDYSGITTDTAMTYTASSASGVKLSHTKKTAITDDKLKVIKTDDFGHIIGARDVKASDIEGLGVASNWEAGQGNGAVLLKNSNGSAAGEFSVSEGKGTTASGNFSHAEGSGTTASGGYSHAEGQSTKANGDYSHAEGYTTTASGNWSHAEGESTTASGVDSHAEGYNTTASGSCSHAEGNSTTASGDCSHAEGYGTKASSARSHAEGQSTKAIGSRSHAEGGNTIASGDCSHAEGYGTKAIGGDSHAEGLGTTASGEYSHAEGNSTTASGEYSHAEGKGTIAMNEGEHACGSYNRSVSGSGQVFSVGAGTSDNNRVNSFYVKNDGTIGSDLDMSISGKSKITLSTASDKLIMNGGTITTNCTMTTGAYFTTSDKRLKTNIIDVTEDEIEKAKKVDLKSFELKRDGKKHFGVVAQEVETAGLAELVNTDSEGMKSVDYTSLLILKIAELEKEIKDLKNQINKK